MSPSNKPNRKTRLLVTLVAGATIGLTACSSATSSGSASPTPSPSPSVTQTTGSASPQPTVTPSDNLDALVVSEGDEPTVQVPAPWAIDQTRAKVLKPGGTQLLAADSTITVNYVGYNGRTGEVFESSWTRGKPATLQLGKVVAGFTKGLTGQAVGSRVLIAMPSSDGYAQGNASAGIEVGDSLIFVVDIISANFPEASGEAVTPAAGLPSVTMTPSGPELAAPTGAAPADLVVQPLIKGTGTAVTKDSTIQVKYRSWIWATGKVWDDAWTPQQGRLSTLIQGWQQGLVGQPAGSRVMLVVPPALAYPDGVPDKKLDAGQTLVFVIDILDATTS